MPFRYRDPTTLREMSDEQLVDSLKSLCDGILRELQRRGFEIELTVLAKSTSADPSAEALTVQLRHPAV